MTIRVLLFASIADALGLRELSLDLNEGATVRDALAMLVREHEPIRGAARSLATAVNASLATPDHPLRHGDELALLPPVSGG